HSGHTLAGILLTVGLYWAAPPLLAWMAPTLVGLVLSIPLSALSGSESFAKVLFRLHLLRIPEEVELPAEFHLRDDFEARLQERLQDCSLRNFLRDPEAL